MHRVFCSPLRHVQGDGVTTRLAAEMGVIGLAGPVLVVAGRSAAKELAAVWGADQVPGSPAVPSCGGGGPAGDPVIQGRSRLPDTMAPTGTCLPQHAPVGAMPSSVRDHDGMVQAPPSQAVDKGVFRSARGFSATPLNHV